MQLLGLLYIFQAVWAEDQASNELNNQQAEENCPMGGCGGGSGGLQGNQYARQVAGPRLGQYAGQGAFVDVSGSSLAGAGRAAYTRPNPNTFYGSQFINQVQNCAPGTDCSGALNPQIAQAPPSMPSEQPPSTVDMGQAPAEGQTVPPPSDQTAPPSQDQSGQPQMGQPQFGAGQPSGQQPFMGQYNMGGQTAGSCQYGGQQPPFMYGMPQMNPQQFMGPNYPYQGYQGYQQPFGCGASGMGPYGSMQAPQQFAAQGYPGGGCGYRMNPWSGPYGINQQVMG